MNSSKNIKIEQTIKKDKKEILNNLLKQLIDQRLTRLEKRNITEVKTLQSISIDAQNLILALENMTNSVRKNISIQRQKNLSNNNKSIKSTSKSKIPSTSPNNFSKTLPKSTSTRGFSKSRGLDSKSVDKYHLLQVDINNRNNKSQIIGNKSKPKKKYISSKAVPKMTDYGRKTVGTTGNVNSNKAGLIPHSKLTRRTASPFTSEKETDKLNKTMGNKPSSITQRKTSGQKKKSVGKELVSKTDKTGKKTIPKFSNNNKNEKQNIKGNTNVNNLHNINTLDKFDSNNLDDSRLKVLDVFNISKKGEKDIEDEGNLNINKEIKNKNNDNKNNKSGFLTTLSKEFEKVGTIKMDEHILKDSLLVSNNIDGEKSVNIDDLLRESTLKEFDIANNQKNKNKSQDINKGKDSKWVKATDKIKALNSSIVIYNKLKRTKVTFLEGEKDFDLIFKDPKIEDMDLELNLNNDLDNDLNATGVSDQMSLEEKFESNLDIIARYLDMRDICNLMSVNKECLKTIINYLVSKTEISIELLEDEIKRLKEYNSNINFDDLKKKPFKLSVNSMRAISLLNSTSGNNILKLNNEQLNKTEIMLVFNLYFVAIGLKKDILILTDIEKIKYIQNYFKNKCIGQNNFGKLIESELNGKVFDDKTISTLYNLTKRKLDIISPNYFQRINKDVAIFVFIIKDLLEQIGLLGSQFTKADKEFLLLNARLQANKAILEELNKIEDNIYY